jgi:hypothetical protein
MPGSILHRSSALRVLVSASVFIAFLLPSVGFALSPNAPLTNFPTETQAQRHCPADTVVWLNPADRDLSLQGATLVRKHELWCLCLPSRSRWGRHAGNGEWTIDNRQ